MVNLERSQAYNKRLKADRLEKSHAVAGRVFQQQWDWSFVLITCAKKNSVTLGAANGGGMPWNNWHNG